MKKTLVPKIMQPIKQSLSFCFLFFILFSNSQNIIIDTLQAREFIIKADSLSQKRQFNSAINYQIKASKLYQIHLLWRDYIKVENKWGGILRKTGQYDNAIEKLENAIQTASLYNLEQSPEAANLYYNIGIVYYYLGKYDRALEEYNKALKIRITHFGEQHPSVATSYNDIGILHKNLGKYSQALKQYRKALKIRIAHFGEQHQDVAISYSNIGVVYRNLGKYSQALEQYNKALRIFITSVGEQHPYVAHTYNNIGIINKSLGKYHQAFAQLNKALNIRITHFGEQHPSVAAAYNNIGVIYNNLGKYHQSLEQHNKALEIKIAHFGEQHPDVAFSYYNIGNIYNVLEKYNQAQEHHKKALKIRITHFGEQHPNVADSYDNIGMVYDNLGKHNQAIEQYNKALKIRKIHFGEQHPSMVYSYNNIGTFYHNLGDYNKALVYYQKAIYINDASLDLDTLVSQRPLKNYLDGNQLLQSLAEKGETLRFIANENNSNSQSLELALNTYQIADTLIQQMRRNTWNELDKLQLAENSTETYTSAIATALQLYQKQKQSHYLDKAFYFSEQNRASILLGVQSKKEALIFGNVPDTLIALELDLKQDKSFYTKQLQRQKDSATEAHNENELFTVNRHLDSLTQFMETNYSDYYQLKYSPKIKSLKKVQTQLAENELLLHYLWDKDTLFGFSITNEDVDIQKIPIVSTFLNSSKILMSHFKNWGKGSNTISNTMELTSYQIASYNVYEKFVAPLLSISTAKIKKLIIIPDGPLSQIPFEVLTTRPPNIKNQSFKNLPYLLKDYSIRYGFSASLTFEHKKTTKNAKQLITFGGFAPSYENATIYTQRIQDSVDNVITQRTIRTIYNDNGALPQLKHNLSEVQTINNVMKGDVFVGEMATVELFKRMASKYRILHIAAHGWVNDSLPEFSGIAFANNTKLTKEENYNFLQMHEIYNMNLNAELVVLSACQTGVGVFQQGEGIMNLGRAFSYAGSSNVLVSQWNVNDANTAELMQYFYNFLSKGMDKDIALQQAKLQFLDYYPGAHPFQWGSFTLWGNDTPIASNSNYWWYILAILILVGLFMLHRLRKF